MQALGMARIFSILMELSKVTLDTEKKCVPGVDEQESRSSLRVLEERERQPQVVIIGDVKWKI